MVFEAITALVKRLKHSLFPKVHGSTPYITTAILTLLLVIGGINLFVQLSIKVKKELLTDFDEIITEQIQANSNSNLTEYFIFVTNVGDKEGYLIILIILSIISFLILKKWRYAMQITVVLALATLSNIILKKIFERPRPEIEHLVQVKTLSYPSGHAMSSIAFYGFLIYLLYKFHMNRYVKISLILILVTLIFSIGISRIYLGVHFPSDVLGGWIAGLIWVFFCIFIFNLVEVFRKKSPF